jgi:type IV pilus assembly protein PilN
MIRVNLLGEKKDMSLQYLVEGGAFLGILAVTLFGCFIAYDSAVRRVDELHKEKANLEQQLSQLARQTKEVDDLEKKRKTLKQKLTTISRLKAKKHGPIHLLSAINDAIPTRAWLTEMKEGAGMLAMTGIALDNQTVAMFMEKLEQSDYFETVDLHHTRQVVLDEVKMNEFSINAKIQDLLELRMKKEKEALAAKEESAEKIKS